MFWKKTSFEREHLSQTFDNNLFIYSYFYLFINLFKVDNDKRDTVNKNTHKIAKG